MRFSDVLPVITGLAIGMMFVVMFSVHANSMPVNSGALSGNKDRIVMNIESLNDAYRTNGPVSFVVSAKGVSDNLCNHPEPSVAIIQVNNGKAIWNTPATVQTVMKCVNVQGIDREWRFGYDGEELPYESALGFDKKYDNNISIHESGVYRIIATFEDNVVEREFAVFSADTGMQVTSEQVPNWMIIEVVIEDSDNAID